MAPPGGPPQQMPMQGMAGLGQGMRAMYDKFQGRNGAPKPDQMAMAQALRRGPQQ
jgi:hypothetical protein